MKVKVWSDVHLEFGNLDASIGEPADVLILAGDVLIARALAQHSDTELSQHDPAFFNSTQALAQRQRDFIRACVWKYPHVLAIAGNHEFYGHDWDETLDQLRSEYTQAGATFLEDESVMIDGVKFIGSTLWTDCNGGNPVDGRYIEQSLNDYHYITTTSRAKVYGPSKHRISIDDTTDRHHQSLYYLNSQLAQWNGPTVVISHHAPTYQSIPPEFRSERSMNGAYASDLSRLIVENPQIQYWFHGHTHTPADYLVHKTRVICNPRGYVGQELQAQNWNQERILEVKP